MVNHNKPLGPGGVDASPANQQLCFSSIVLSALTSFYGKRAFLIGVDRKQVTADLPNGGRNVSDVLPISNGGPALR